MNDNTKPMDRFERGQLWSIGNSVYGDGRPYWWGEKSMPKLAARGFVEPHPDYPKAWRITPAGQAERKLVWRERIAKGDAQ